MSSDIIDIRKINELDTKYGNDIISKSYVYGVGSHFHVNQYYDIHHYDFHLNMVFEYVLKYIHLVEHDDYDNIYIASVIASSFTHDLIEDARQTYNDVLKKTNKIIAEITYAVTDEKGKNRKQRKNAKFYRELKKVPLADFIKICDRLANAKFSYENKSRMSETYKNEYIHFKNMLYKDEYKPMFDELDTFIL